MLSAEEARQELRRNPVYRIKQGDLEVFQLVGEMFASDLENEIEDGIEKQLSDNQTSLKLSYDVSCYTTERYGYWYEPGLDDKYELINYNPEELVMDTSTREAFFDIINTVINNQKEELEALGYKTTLEYEDRCLTNRTLKDNHISLTIDWKEETKDAETDFFQKKCRLRKDAADIVKKEVAEKTCVLNSEDKINFKRWFGR